MLHCTLVCDSAAMHRAVSEQVQKNAKNMQSIQTVVCVVVVGSRQGEQQLLDSGECFTQETPPAGGLGHLHLFLQLNRVQLSDP